VADAAAQTGNVAGMITEVKLSGGAVDVRALGKGLPVGPPRIGAKLVPN
jgi:hypothetical protein